MRPSRYAPMREQASKLFSASSWPSVPAMFTHGIRRKLRSTRSKLRTRSTPASNITKLQTSFSPAQTLRALRAHQWSVYDGQYCFLAILGIFSLCVMKHPGPLIKTLVAALLMTSVLLPVTRQFFLPFLPVATWLVLFYSAQFINAEYRPPIWVRVLPALENIFYGANLSNILAAHKRTLFDVLAWLPYGITHFGAPVVCSGLMFIFAPPKTVPQFARAFGYMNIAGVLIQLTFPCSPPWYENLYGLAPANYSMPGSPAGLAAIDKLFGIDLYTSTFTASPMVFGAFPSLHAGSATIEALFMSHTFPKLRPLFILYTLWLCWATMYLTHHYAVDLAAGSLLAGICYFISAAKFLPRLQPGKLYRWDYDYIELGEESAQEGYAYGLTDLDDDEENFQQRQHFAAAESGDEWSLGSSSSYSAEGMQQGRRSPESSVGLRSPVDDPEAWEGETLASGSDPETK